MAELLVRAAAERGLPVAVYRPSRISGHSLTDAWNAGDAMVAALVGCLQLGLVPDLPTSLSLCPVDHVARAIVWLGDRAAADHGTYHLASPEPLALDAIVDALRDEGFAFERVSYSSWRTALSRARADNPLRPYLPYLLEHGPEQVLGRTVRSERTQRLLGRGGIVCPTIDARSFVRQLGPWIAPFAPRM